MKTDGEQQGVIFPKDERGKRSTLAGGKLVFAAAARAIDAKLAEAIMSEKNWRQNYAKHLVVLTERAAKSPDLAIKAAEAGLEATYSNFEFARDGGTVSLDEAMAQPSEAHALTTGEIMGASEPGLALEMPYEGKVLSGAAAAAQVNAWREYGCMEPDCADALSSLATTPSSLDLRGKVFVVLGATSALGPLEHLLRWGATVVGVARRKPSNWLKLIQTARGSAGRFFFPLFTPTDASASDETLAGAAGADLITEAPEVGAWLRTLLASLGGSAVVGMYTYLDSDAHVRVSLACDAIMKAVVPRAGAGSLAFIQTPSICYDVPAAAHAAAEAAYSSSWLRLVGFPSNARAPITPLEAGAPLRHVHDGFISMQGPNYALAKTLQAWRAMLARWRDGIVVSANIAPAARTASMVAGNKNAGVLSNALDGMTHFKPLAVFDQETVSVAMAALLVFDVTSPASPANPTTALAHPHEVTSSLAFHGGTFRVGAKPGDLGTLQVMSGKMFGRGAAPVATSNL